MSQLSFSVISPSPSDWVEIESCVDATVFHTKSWDAYLSSLGKKHIVIAISDENLSRVGFFIGTKSWLGVRIIGSPGGGAGTFAQGLCLKEEVDVEDRIRIYQELVAFCFKRHLAGYIQITDWRLMNVEEDMDARMTWSMPVLNQLGIYYSLRISFFIDTRLPEDVLWDNYHITSIMLNKPKDIMMACSIGEWKYDKSITGFLYISSRSIIDQYMELEDYSDKVYEKEVIIKL